MVDIGPRTELNVFELNGDGAPEVARGSMFSHGPIDHMGLQAADRDAFVEIRRRLIGRGASDGFVTDFGRAHSVFFRDPDGLEGEVLLWLSHDARGEASRHSCRGLRRLHAAPRSASWRTVQPRR